MTPRPNQSRTFLKCWLFPRNVMCQSCSQYTTFNDTSAVMQCAERQCMLTIMNCIDFQYPWMSWQKYFSWMYAGSVRLGAVTEAGLEHVSCAYQQINQSSAYMFSVQKYYFELSTVFCAWFVITFPKGEYWSKVFRKRLNVIHLTVWDHVLLDHFNWRIN